MSMYATSEGDLFSAVAGIKQDTVARFGQLDVAANVVNMYQRHLSLITDLDVEDIQTIIHGRVFGLFDYLKEELKAIKDGGSIVNVGGVMSKYASPGLSAYAAAKHALVGLNEVAAFGAAVRVVRVNMQFSGSIDTDTEAQPFRIASGVEFTMPEPGVPRLLKWYAKPEEIAASITFLLDDESQMVTEAEWCVYGGWVEGNFLQ
ncbi:uncharacterized protein BCR38DRAFT_466825 [Pseudomassariella vexata]|uniref:Uncharacterized protein n=1 Tax=Pseudomassariella vexata TaxID=1141098 RepID=A0A1Y2DWK6_9PEZI|nr:uncharacterized protein BCR38DRAFT_466825 [Pseudomassariella vexata]ORY63579.1 hypothetical protein BCR38DRAFT_466825 [Pseudomassariella vexata]